MYLLEHDAKEILSAHGIPSPAGTLIENADAINASVLPPGPWIVKGQIAAGGRGKAGIIRKAHTIGEACDHAASIIGSNARGHPVRSVRIEQLVDAAHEAYLALLLDAASAQVRVIASGRGGMDIEQVPREHICSALARPDTQLIVQAVHEVARSLPADIGAVIRQAGERAARAFVTLEALLIEINPLFVFDDGRWAAGDAKVVVDDNALARQPQLRALLDRRAAVYPETALKLEHGFDYVVVDPEGEIGLLTTGAGLSMMLIDEMREAGLKPYNFLDIRTGGLRGEIARLVNVLEWIAGGPRVRVLLVNIFAGITDLAEFSRLLVEALAAVPRLKVPVVARLVGNGLPAAREVLAAAGIPLHVDLDDALAAVRETLA
ncbi:MAG TPA: ATP-grasp domain-containing protein [Burkholderiales bacterium]|nr:ATP-grasp domain-containing protein [Burkholderiales bacterium]